MAILALLVLLPAVGADPAVVDLALAGDLVNRGAVGGEAVFHTWQPGAPAGFDLGPFGDCLDLTAAPRHGGGAADQEPVAESVTLAGDGLRDLETFSLVLWARQSPVRDGVSARYGMTTAGWDWLPSAGGFTLSLGAEAAKVGHHFSAAPFERGRRPAATDWRFVAVTVGPDLVRGWLGSLAAPPRLLGELPRQGPRVADWGELELGSFRGLRPFCGWLARFRAFRGELPAEAIQALYEADLALATAAAPRLAAARRPDPPARAWQFPKSAIPFSTRWQKPAALDVMRSFHTTDLLWVYGTKGDYVQQAKGLGVRYQGTLNGLQGTGEAAPGPSNAGDPSGRHEDLDGQKNMPRWMVTFKPPHWTGCVNSPAFRAIFWRDAKQLVDLGVDALQVDDGAMNGYWATAGLACFCDACRAGFRDYLRQQHTPAELAALGVTDPATFDYRQHLQATGVPDAATYRAKLRSLPLTPDFLAYQVASTRQFYREFRQQLDAWSPTRRIALAVNETLGHCGTDGRLLHVDLVDFLLGEVYDRSFGYNLLLGKAAEACGVTQVASPVPNGVGDCLRTTALAYALGQIHLVPWDLYMGSDATGSQPRYFGTREEYGAVYDLIHAHPELFDPYRPVAEVGVLFNADHDQTAALRPVCEALAAAQVPFSVQLVATQQARVPLRAEDLRPLRLLLTVSPVDSLGAADRATLEAALVGRRLRLADATADWPAMLATRELDVLAVEGPPGVYAFPRAAADGSQAVHVVNWNLAGEQAEVYRHVTVSLRHPERWGSPAAATWSAPGEPPVRVEAERHRGAVRLTIPRLATWGILKLEAQP